jgi:PPOX class probable F420-dependent enzyme
MSTALTDPKVLALLEPANYAVVSSINADGSILSTIVWQNMEDGVLKVNSAVGRRWPTNLQRNPQVNLTVIDAQNPYHFVEIRGTATGTLDDADDHIDRLAKKYLGVDTYPYRQPGEQRITFAIEPSVVRFIKQG